MDEIRTRVRVVSGTEAVAATLDALPDDMRPSAFQHRAFVRAWLAGTGHGTGRRVVALVDCAATGRPLFALPLVLDSFGAAAYWAPFDAGVCDYNASFVAPDFRPTATEMTAIWTRILTALPDEASFLYIDKLPAGLGGHGEPLIDLPGLRRSHVVRHPLRLDADYPTLRGERFSQTMVRSLDRKRRKLTRKGRLAFTVETGEAALPVLDRLMTWRGERYGDRPAIDAFYRGLTAAGDPARLLWLALDDEPIAACFGLVERDAFRLLAVGHEERWKNWSPGLLVIEDAVAWACAEGFGEFDFTIGSEPYKFDFGVTPEPLWLFAEEFGPHGSAMLRLMLARNLIAKNLKRWIDVHGPRKRDAKASAAA